MSTQGLSTGTGTGSTTDYRSQSYFHLGAGQGAETIQLTTRPVGTIEEILFVPDEGVCIPLTAGQVQLLVASEQRLDGAAGDLAKARDSGDAKQIQQAQAQMRETLRVEAEPSAKKNDASKDLPPLVVGGQPKFKEALRIGERKYSLIPAHVLERFRKRPDGASNLYSMKEAIKASWKREESKPTNTSESATTSESTSDPRNMKTAETKDAFGPWRDEKGKLNAEKFKETFAEVKKKIAKDWKLVDEKGSGQIATATIVNPVIAAIFRDELEVLDEWIGQFNENAKWAFNRHEEAKTKLLQRLKQEAFTPEDWDGSKTAIKDIWGEESSFATEMNQRSMPKNAEERSEIHQLITEQPVPPVRYDASAGAQLMRYSWGVTSKFEVDIAKKGKVAINAKAELDLALAEGKAEGNFYLPSDQGKAFSPKVNVLKEQIRWKIRDSSYEFADSDKLPHFGVDSCLMTPGGFQALYSLICRLPVLKSTSPRDQLMIQLVGHTSLTGSEAHNQRLSERRAASVYGLIKEDANAWIRFFEQGIWGEDEVRFLGICVILFHHNDQFLLDWADIDDYQDLQRRLAQVVPSLLKRFPDPVRYQRLQRLLVKDIRLFLLNLMTYAPEIQFSGSGRPMPVPPTVPEWKPKTEFGVRTLNWLVRAYFMLLRKARSLMGFLQKEDYFSLIDFYPEPYHGKGESDPLKAVQAEYRPNRRVEFVTWEIDLANTKTDLVETQVEFGDFRLAINGSISAWAGANIVLAGHLEFDPEVVGPNKLKQKKQNPDGRLPLAGWIKDSPYKNSLGGEAGLFAGAKAELGLKASIDWRPSPEKSDQPLPAPMPFKTLGSAGYSLSGLAGMGLNGDLKFGFDPEAKRFVIRVGVKAALGLGFGGTINFTVGVWEIGEFMVLVYQKLEEANFAWIDLFETEEDASAINVFDAYSAFAWKLMRSGLVPQSMLAFSGVAISEFVVDTLSDVRGLIKEWSVKRTNYGDIENLLTVVERQPQLLRFLTPETKGRVLFELMQSPKQAMDYVSDLLHWDKGHRREEAALTLIRSGIVSKRDWRETLEHLCDLSDDEIAPYVVPGASVPDKVVRLNRNRQLLRSNLLNDDEDWLQVEQLVSQLPD